MMKIFQWRTCLFSGKVLDYRSPIEKGDPEETFSIIHVFTYTTQPRGMSLWVFS
jgi:hypothetical protein